jgi:hypothetical protein
MPAKKQGARSDTGSPRKDLPAARRGNFSSSLQSPNPQASNRELARYDAAFLADSAERIRTLGKRVIGDVIEIGPADEVQRCIVAPPEFTFEPGQPIAVTDELAKSRNFRDLSLPVTSLYLLAKPSTAESARDEIFARADSGERVKHEEVRAIIAAHSPDAVRKAAETLQAQEDPAEGGINRGVNTGSKMHPYAERGLDLYETPPEAVRALLKVEKFAGPIWEPACGPGAIVRELRATGHGVVATDIEDYGCPDSRGGVDFLMEQRAPDGVETVLTNPPFMHADAFVRHALTLVPWVFLLLRFLFLEGQGRADIIDSRQLSRVHLFIDRVPMMHRSGWQGDRTDSSHMALAWFCWDRNYDGPITVNRIWCREKEAGAKPPDSGESWKRRFDFSKLDGGAS